MGLNVAALVFDHARGQPGTPTVPLRYDGQQPVLLPEWQRGQRLPSVAAYAIDRLAAVATVLVRFVATPDMPRRFDVRALAEPLPGAFPPAPPLLGNLAPQTIDVDAQGLSGWRMFAFETTRLAAGVDACTQHWRWQTRIAGGSWTDADRTLHRVYALLGRPTEPWRLQPANPVNPALPRSDMLDVACLWARAARTSADAAARITAAVNRLGGTTLFYDAQVGGPHYTLLGASLFLCDAFLDRLRGGSGAGPLVNCSDCATIVSTFANLLGADLWQSKMGLVGLGFRLNPILAIGATDWSTLHGSFGFHEVAWEGACGEEQRVYDACVSVDGDPDPTVTPHVPLLPRGMRFGRPGDGHYRDRMATLADRDECVPQPTLRIRRAVAEAAGFARPRLTVPVVHALRARAGAAEDSSDSGYRFEDFCWFGNELGRDWLPSVCATVTAPSRATERRRSTMATWKLSRSGAAALRIEAIEGSSAAAAREAMLEVVAGIAAPELQPWPERPEGEHGVALENGGLVVFTRGNLVVVVASAGLEPIDVRPVARRVDAWLVGAGVEPAAPDRIGMPPGALWLRWNDDRRERTPAAPASDQRPMARRPTVVTPRHGAAFSARQS